MVPLAPRHVVLAAAPSGSGPGSGNELTGLAGWTADVIAALGAPGVALLTALENLFPPIPSEVVLPLAGYLASRGELNLVLAIVASTIGSLLGAIVLYEAAAALGLERIQRVLEKVPLMDSKDLERAQGWFDRHGSAAVFFGRFVPGIRSLVSIPAGTGDLSRPKFWLYTLAGSAIWNTIWVMAGWALGSAWRSIGRYSDWINYAIIAVIVVAVAKFVWDRRERLPGVSASSSG